MFLFALLGAVDLLHGKNRFQEAADSYQPGPQNEYTRSRPESRLQGGVKPGQTCNLKQNHPAEPYRGQTGLSPKGI